MKPVFFLVVVSTATTLFLGPLIAFAVLLDPEGADVVLLVVGAQLCAFGAMLRALFVATAPSRRPGQGRRWRRRVPAAGMAVGLVLLLAGLVGAAGALQAILVVASYGAGLVGLAVLLDRYATRVAQDAPIDVALDADALVLEPAALRARLLRVTLFGLEAGVFSGAVVAAIAVSVDARPRTGMVLTFTSVVFVAAVVATIGTLRPMLAASRRVNAVLPGGSGQTWRISWAIMLGRADRLPAQDREIAPRWAEAALPMFSTQFVFQTSVFLLILLGQLGPFALEPEAGARAWWVSTLVALLLVVVAALAWQYISAVRFLRLSQAEDAPRS